MSSRKARRAKDSHQTKTPEAPVEDIGARYLPVHSLAVWLSAIVSGMFAAAAYWVGYREILQIGPMPLWDWGVFPWTLLAIWLGINLPVVGICQWLIARRHPRIAWGCFGTVTFLFWVYLLGDLYAYRSTGQHLAYYLPFVLKPVAGSWIGGFGQFVAPVAWMLIAVALRTLVPMGIAYIAAMYLLRFAGRERVRWCGRAVMVLYAILLLGAVPAQFAMGNNNRLGDMLSCLPVDFSDLAIASDQGAPDAFERRLNELLRPLTAKDPQSILTPRPIDERDLLHRKDPPNVIILVLDSLRRDMLTAQWMPRLSRWAHKGMVLEKHNAGVNRTDVAFFTILYGRSTVFYQSTLNEHLPPQLPITLRRGGYECTEWSDVDAALFFRMGDFIKVGPAFNRLEKRLDQGWAKDDPAELEGIRKQIQSAGNKPQFIMALLSATHYPYEYPASYQKYLPICDPSSVMFQQMATQVENAKPLFNRYKNAVAFMDDQVGRFLDSIDMSRNIVVVMGDHGESFGEDGMLLHAGRVSDVQTEPACFIVGAGVPVEQIDQPTQHIDLLPTLLHLVEGRPVEVEHCQGRDILSQPPRPCRLLVPISEPQPKVYFALRDGERRMQFSMDRQTAYVQYLGRMDARGIRETAAPPPAEEAGFWAKALGVYIQSWTR